MASVVEQVKSSPGVRTAAAVFGLPLGGGFSFHQYVVAGQAIPPPSERPRAGIRLVSEDYFDLMGVRLKAGRVFTDRDRAGAPMVCMVNESMARRVFNGQPLGQSILRGRDANLRYEIVGVVEDILTYGVRRPAVDEVFYPLRQLPWPNFAIVARTGGDPAAARRLMETVVSRHDPALPLVGFSTMQQLFAQSTGSERTLASITVAFAAIAVLMAIVGLYAVLAQGVASRRTEIGVRVALGADRRRIVGLVLQGGMTIAIAGIGVGLAVAVAGARYVAAQLHEVNPRDPLVYLGVAVAFAFVAMLACLVPSWRAARLDPIAALRRI
jgi:putative ABC transport system permease protein